MNNGKRIRLQLLLLIIKTRVICGKKGIQT